MNGVGVRRCNPKISTLTKALTSCQHPFRQSCVPYPEAGRAIASQNFSSISTGRIRTHPLLLQAQRSFSKSAIVWKNPVVTVTNATRSGSSSINRRVPRKAAVQMTEEARTFLKSLLGHAKEEIIGIILKYEMSSGKFRMVFKFDFIKAGDIGENDEGVSLEVLEDGSPKPPSESLDDGIPKLYVHANAFLKVLGGTVDVKFNDDGSFIPVLYDREGNVMDPNA